MGEKRICPTLKESRRRYWNGLLGEKAPLKKLEEVPLGGACRNIRQEYTHRDTGNRGNDGGIHLFPRSLSGCGASIYRQPL